MQTIEGTYTLEIVLNGTRAFDLPLNSYHLAAMVSDALDHMDELVAVRPSVAIDSQAGRLVGMDPRFRLVEIDLDERTP